MSRRLSLKLFLCLALLLGGCRSPDVVAVVGKAELEKADVAEWAERRGLRNEKDQTPALDALIDRQILAELARKEGLAQDARVRARIQAATREILAHELLERSVESATRTEALQRRYEEKKPELEQTRIHLRHVMVRLPSDASADARRAAQNRINHVFARLTEGATFEEILAEANVGGVVVESADLGMIKEGEIDSSLFEAGKTLAAKEISKPVESPFGLHVLQATESPVRVVPEFDEAKPALAAAARREVQKDVLERARQQISVKRFPERLASTQRPSGEAQ